MTAYLVPDHVRVRAEDFGLLFYDTRSTRLTFVRSGHRLAAPPFVGQERVLTVAGDPSDPAGGHSSLDPALSRALSGLVEKGLLRVLPSE